MKQLYLGLVAKAAAGKTTFVKKTTELAARYGITVAHCSSGGIVRGTFSKWGIREEDQTRAIQDQLVQFMQKVAKNEAVLTNAVERELLASRATMTFLDAIRRPSDEEMFRRLPNGIIVFITAPDKKRHEWAQLRAEKPEERDMPLAQFLAQERSLPQEQFIDDIGKRAHETLNNDSNTAEEYYAKIEDFFFRVLRQRL